MTWIGRIVAKGPWAGWRVTSCRAVATDYTVVKGVVTLRWFHGPFRCACRLEDPKMLTCTAAGIVLTEADLVSVQGVQRERLRSALR